MKVKYCLSILLLVVLLLALNPENISMAQEDTTVDESIEVRGFAPPLIGYQGRLLENGTPVTGNRTMTFKLFHSQGAAIWEETKSIMVTNGLFQTDLGDTTPFPFATINEMDHNLWLEVTVGSNTMPRQLLTGSPYAFSLVPGARITGDTTDFILQAVNDSGTGLFGGSRFGTGVFGESFGEGSTGLGVHGVSEAGVGVLGASVGEGSTSPGVVGLSESGTGVYGSGGTGVSGESKLGTGVYGSSEEGRGVVGSSDQSSGVEGWSISDNGVHGISTTGNAVFGESDSGSGVHGISTTGTAVFGEGDSGAGVTGTSIDAAGVNAYSENGPGIWVGSDSGGEDPWPALHAHGLGPNGIGIVSMTDSTNTNMALEQMGEGPLLKAYSPNPADPDIITEKASIENDGSFKQALEANGLVKAAALFYCSGPGGSGSHFDRYFNNGVSGSSSITVDDGVAFDGHCFIDFGFDISQRFWIAQNPDTNRPLDIVTCSQENATTLSCWRFDPTTSTSVNGDIMLIVY